MVSEKIERESMGIVVMVSRARERKGWVLVKDDVLEEIIHENSLPREKRERYLKEEKNGKRIKVFKFLGERETQVLYVINYRQLNFVGN